MSRLFVVLVVAILAVSVLLVTVIVGYEPPLPPGWYLQGPAV